MEQSFTFDNGRLEKMEKKKFEFKLYSIFIDALWAYGIEHDKISSQEMRNQIWSFCEQVTDDTAVAERNNLKGVDDAEKTTIAMMSSKDSGKKDKIWPLIEKSLQSIHVPEEQCEEMRIVVEAILRKEDELRERN